MIRPYRCLNCCEHPDKFDFYADESAGPVACPNCQLNMKEFPDHVIALVLLHFDPPSKAKGRGLRRRACDPHKPSTLSNPDDGLIHGATGHAPSVTCPDCRKTEVYRGEVAKYDQDRVWRPSDEAPAIKPVATDATIQDEPARPGASSPAAMENTEITKST